MDIWQYLENKNSPVLIYGTGNGADRVMDILSSLGIEVGGIFASSSFVRERTFRGLKVKSFEECKKCFPDAPVLMCFGSARDEVIENVRRMKNECEILAPDVPVYGNAVFTTGFYKSKLNSFLKIRSCLADEKSSNTFSSLINYKLTGNIDYLFSCEEKEEDVLKLISLEADAVYLDLGAYNGDTVLYYNNHFHFDKIIALEPEKRNFRRLKENTADIENISYYNALISDENGIKTVEASQGRGTHENEDGNILSGSNPVIIKNTSDGERLIYVKEPSVKNKKTAEIQSFTLDYISEQENIKKDACIFIKADVEGDELKFIRGAYNTIKNYSPVMRIACYHRTEDYYALPEAVLDINPSYKIYMRHIKGIPAWETDYIFIPDK